MFQQTDVGRAREHNEDSSYADPHGRYFIVADGMGGHAAGEVASQLAVDAVRACLDGERATFDALGSGTNGHETALMTGVVERAGQQANTAVRKRASQDSKTRGMGTTLEFAVVTAGGAWIGHVGDSRTYLISGTSVSQLTKDHTFAEHLAKNQKLAPGNAAKKYGNILVEAVGAKDEVRVDVVHTPLEAGDRLLLCSDGLYQYFPRADEIGEILVMDGSKAGLARLIDEANERGGRDNITGVLVEVLEFASSTKPVSAPPSQSPLPSTYSGPSAAEQEYGIDEAIALVRKLPAQDLELEIRVVKGALESANIRIEPIIEDAAETLARIERRVAALKEEIAQREQDKADCLADIARQEEDLAETSLVKSRLELAERKSRN